MPEYIANVCSNDSDRENSDEEKSDVENYNEKN